MGEVSSMMPFLLGAAHHGGSDFSLRNKDGSLVSYPKYKPISIDAT